jgi:acyl carrier protein
VNDAARAGFTRSALVERLYTLLGENTCVKVEELSEEKTLRGDLHLDSFDLVCVLTAAENEIGITVSDAEAKTMMTIRDVVEQLWMRLG